MKWMPRTLQLIFSRLALLSQPNNLSNKIDLQSPLSHANENKADLIMPISNHAEPSLLVLRNHDTGPDMLEMEKGSLLSMTS